MLNKVTLKGNIGQTPWIGLTQYGREIATFSLATNTSWKDEAGEWQTHTDWHRITVFRTTTIGWIKDVLKRGDTVYVEGKLTYHHWRDKYNNVRLTPYIVIAGSEGKIEHIRSSQPKNFTQPIRHASSFLEKEDTFLSQKLKNHEKNSLEKSSLRKASLRELPVSTHPQHFQKEKI